MLDPLALGVDDAEAVVDLDRLPHDLALEGIHVGGRVERQGAPEVEAASGIGVLEGLVELIGVASHLSY